MINEMHPLFVAAKEFFRDDYIGVRRILLTEPDSIRYAMRLATRPDVAEDLTQETMLRGLRNLRKLRDPRVTRV